MSENQNALPHRQSGSPRTRKRRAKSTLMNRLVAEKVAIVSDKPQTTRSRVIGVLSEPRGQVVFLDTPGIHKPQHRDEPADDQSRNRESG